MAEIAVQLSSRLLDNAPFLANPTAFNSVVVAISLLRDEVRERKTLPPTLMLLLLITFSSNALLCVVVVVGFVTFHDMWISI